MDSLVLKSIKSCEKFESKEGLDWARRIIVDYYTRTEEGWLLGCMVKVQSGKPFILGIYIFERFVST